MPRIETTPWDAVDTLRTPEDVAALDDVARSKGMAKIAQATDLEL